VDESATAELQTESRLSSLGELLASDNFAASLLLLVGMAIALGPTLGAGPPAAVFVCWVIGTIYWLAAKASNLTSFTPAIRLLAVTAFVFATVRLAALGLVKYLLNRPALFWNIDWRYHATHSQTISRFGNLSDSLDYAGVPTTYHAGPAWFSGGLERLIGLNPDLTLFVFFPIIALPAMGYWLYRLFRTFGFPSASSLMIVSVLINFVKVPRFIFNPDPLKAGSFLISPSTMLNSLLGLVFVFAGLSLVFSRRSTMRSVALGSMLVGISSCSKPQYALLGAALVPVLLILRMVREGGGWRRASAFVGFTCLVPVVMMAASPRASSVDSAISIGFPLWEHFSPEVGFFVRALVLMSILGYVTSDDVVRQVGKSAIMLSIVVFCLGIIVTATRYTEGVIEERNAVEIGYSTGGIWYSGLNQWFTPFAFIASGTMLGIFARVVCVKEITILKGLVASALVLCAPVTFLPIIDPTGSSAYEWVEDRSLYRLMEDQAVEDGLWLSNDLADPAENFRRRLNALHLTSAFPAQFYVSNLRYERYREPDAGNRLLATKRFYLTEWSDWHSAFLVANEIRFALVHQRCKVEWETPSGISYSESSDGPWTLLKFDLGSPESSDSLNHDNEALAFPETATRCL